MSKIPAELLKEILADDFYKTCSRQDLHGHRCDGRITFEHVLTYGGKQIQRKWAIIPLCAHGHAVDFFQDQGDLDKKVNLWVALNRATDDELSYFSKAVNYLEMKRRLNAQWGVYKPPVLLKTSIEY